MPEVLADQSECGSPNRNETPAAHSPALVPIASVSPDSEDVTPEKNDSLDVGYDSQLTDSSPETLQDDRIVPDSPKGWMRFFLILTINLSMKVRPHQTLQCHRT